MVDRDRILINGNLRGPNRIPVKVNVYFGGRKIKILRIFKTKTRCRNNTKTTARPEGTF